MAAISAIAFTGVQSRARTSAVRTDLTNVKKKLMLYRADSGRYPVNIGELTSVGIRIGSESNYDIRPGYSNFYYCADVANNEFAIGVRVASSPVASFYISSLEDISPRSGLISQTFTCNTIGLPGSTSEQGTYSESGLSLSGYIVSWLNNS